jgi:hypothetical protein
MYDESLSTPIIPRIYTALRRSCRQAPGLGHAHLWCGGRGSFATVSLEATSLALCARARHLVPARGFAFSRVAICPARPRGAARAARSRRGNQLRRDVTPNTTSPGPSSVSYICHLRSRNVDPRGSGLLFFMFIRPQPYTCLGIEWLTQGGVAYYFSCL